MTRYEGTNLTIHPQYVVGFVDGEGCFCVVLSRHQTLRTRREVRLTFEIEVREDDRPILQAIQRLIDCGTIYTLRYARYKKWRPHVKLKVSNLRDIVTKVIPFFERHPLQAKKRKSFAIFKRIAVMMQDGKHLTVTGQRTIERLQQRMNR